MTSPRLDNLTVTLCVATGGKLRQLLCPARPRDQIVATRHTSSKVNNSPITRVPREFSSKSAIRHGVTGVVRSFGDIVKAEVGKALVQFGLTTGVEDEASQQRLHANAHKVPGE